MRTSDSTRSRAATASLILLSLLAPASFAGEHSAATGATEPAMPAGLRLGPDAARMHYDQPGDGSLWARGTSYKVGFDGQGATFYPRTGAAERSVPHRLTPDRVTVGGEPLAFDAGATASLAGDSVELDRGAFVERYDLAIESLEQTFTFATLPRRGELVVHIPVASELAAFETSAGLEFRGERGSVSYSRAVAIDAHGVRSTASTRVEDGAIVIHVDEAFLASAAMPLVIDPVVTSLWFDSTTDDHRSPDVAWDPFEGVWLAVYQETFSATDTDVFARMVSSSGALLASAYVDFTSAAWAAPRVADLASAQSFLCVAQITSATPNYIRGRIVEPNGTIITQGSQFDIVSQGCSNCAPFILPDVGGDPSPTGPGTWCVVYEADFPNNDKEIAFRRVNANGTLVGTGPTYLAVSDGGTLPATAPSISKSNGGDEWLVAWRRDDMQFRSNIMGAWVRKDGVVTHPAFSVSPWGINWEFTPSASSPLDGSGRGMVAYRRGLSGPGSDSDVVLAALDGSTVLQILNVNYTLNPSDSVDQLEPSIDSDGQHFVVSYSEEDPQFSNYDAIVTDVFLSDNQIGFSQPHVTLFHIGLWERHSQISAQHSTTGHSRRYFAVYDVRQNDQDYDMAGTLFDALEGGSVTPFCFGDGTGTACPCGNNGIAGRGCANSVNSYGALLASVGSASTADDNLRLDASGMPSTATCIFLQGSTSSAAAAFGDGLRCVSGSLIRMATKTASAGSASFPTGADPSVSVRGSIPAVGATRPYQVWYRNPQAFCTSATFNISNGLLVSWAP